jgi:hypothetical protein
MTIPPDPPDYSPEYFETPNPDECRHNYKFLGEVDGEKFYKCRLCGHEYQT